MNIKKVLYEYTDARRTNVDHARAHRLVLHYYYYYNLFISTIHHDNSI